MEGKVGFWCKRNGREGGREMPARPGCQETIVLCIMNTAVLRKVVG